MRFTINREQLLKGLNIAMKAVDPKSALPHLTNVKMSLNNKGLELTGINSHLTIRTTIPYMIGDDTIISNYKYIFIFIKGKEYIFNIYIFFI